MVCRLHEGQCQTTIPCSPLLSNCIIEVASFIASSDLNTYHAIAPFIRVTCLRLKSRMRSEAFKEVQKELLHIPKVSDFNQLVDISRRVASEFSQQVPVEISFIPTVNASVSTVLRLFFIFIYHKHHVSERNVAKTDNMMRVVKSSVHVLEDNLVDIPALEQQMGHRFHLFKPIALTSQKSDTSVTHSIIGSYGTGVTPANADTQEFIKRHFPDIQFVKSIQVISENEYVSTST